MTAVGTFEPPSRQLPPSPEELAVLGASAVPALGGAPAAGATTINFGNPVWTVGPLNDAGRPIALSSPNRGDTARRAGRRRRRRGRQRLRLQPRLRRTGVDVQHRRSGRLDPVGGRRRRPGAPSTPSSSAPATPAARSAGGYQAVSPSGGDQWFVQETNPPTDSTAHNGVQASMAVGDLQSGIDVVAGSLGENEYAMTAGSGGVLDGFPWYQGDSNFTTPALADLYGNGQTEIVEGGDSTAGNSYTTPYANGGHIRVLRADRQRRPAQTQRRPRSASTQRTRPSSRRRPSASSSAAPPSASSSAPAPPSTSPTPTSCSPSTPTADCSGRRRSTATPTSSPALADVLGNGQLQVVEGTDNGRSGSVYALNGANGSVAWSTSVGRVIGSVVTADLGSGLPGRARPDRQRRRRPRRQDRERHHDAAVRHRLPELAADHQGPERDDRHHPRRLPGLRQLHLPLRDRRLERVRRQRARCLAAVPPRRPAHRERRHPATGRQRAVHSAGRAPRTATTCPPPTAASSATATCRSAGRPATSCSTSRSSAWPSPATAAATGRSPRTAASSPSATPRSTARWAASRSTSRSSAWPPTRTATATGRSRPTAGSSPSAQRRSTARWAASR